MSLALDFEQLSKFSCERALKNVCRPLWLGRGQNELS